MQKFCKAIENDYNNENETVVVRREKKSDTKNRIVTHKKRVSFHDDILNSTKIDDIHINRGLITYLPDNVNHALLEKQGIVVGRCFSWSIDDVIDKEFAKIERETQSELFSSGHREDSDISCDSTNNNTTASSNSSLYTFPYFSNLKKTSSFSRSRPYSDSYLNDSNNFLSSGLDLCDKFKHASLSNKTLNSALNRDVSTDEKSEVDREEYQLKSKVLVNNVVEYQGIICNEQYKDFIDEYPVEEKADMEVRPLLKFYQKLTKALGLFKCEATYQNIDFFEKNALKDDKSIKSCQDLANEPFEDEAIFTNKTSSKGRRNKAAEKSNRNSLLVLNTNQKTLLIDVNKKINSEIKCELNKKNENDASTKHEFFSKDLSHIIKYENEKIIQAYKIWTSNTTPELLVLTNMAINFALVTYDSTISICSFHCLLNDIHSILIGPNNYWLMVTNRSEDIKRYFFMLSKKMTTNFVQKLEIQMRKRNCELPVFRQLNFMTNAEMKHLWTFVASHRDLSFGASHCDQPYFYYYGIVRVHCFNHLFETLGVTGSGMDLSFVSFPHKEGALMFQVGTSEISNWDTGYFILKGGILYVFSSTRNKFPLRTLLLASGRCELIRRTSQASRPHTFEIVYDDFTYLMAASDDSVASEWLQVLIETVGSGYNPRTSFEQNTVLKNTEICTILLTKTCIHLIRENIYDFQKMKQAYEMIACANLSDLVSLQLPSKKDESWCILEFECQEVLENSGDWILYFGADEDMMEFFNLLEILWNSQAINSFPIKTIDEQHGVYGKFVNTFNYLMYDLWPKKLNSFY